jgi:hypothetical protein
MRYGISIGAIVEVKSEAEARVAAKKMEKLLANPTLKMLLKAEGVVLVGHVVDPNPSPR